MLRRVLSSVTLQKQILLLSTFGLINIGLLMAILSSMEDFSISRFPLLKKMDEWEIKKKSLIFWEQMLRKTLKEDITLEKMLVNDVEHAVADLLTKLDLPLEVPHPEHANLSLLKDFDTCAVVSSAYELKLNEHGKHIDSNGLVIRVNNGTVEGYEGHVGSRTDWRLINNKVVKKLYINMKQNGTELFNRTEKLITFSYCENLNSTAAECEKTDKTKRRVAALNAKSTDKSIYMLPANSFLDVVQFIKQVRNVKLGGLYPTTGFLAILLALMHCDVVHAYGFIPLHGEKYCHYYPDSTKPCGLEPFYHARIIEKLIMLELAEYNDQLLFGHGILRFNRLFSRRD